MKKRIILLLIISSAFGQTGIEIAKMVDAKPSPKDMSNTTRMVLTNAKGKSRTNVMVSKGFWNQKMIKVWPSLKLSIVIKMMKCVCGFRHLKRSDAFHQRKRGTLLWVLT